jgi:hypothetical protein
MQRIRAARASGKILRDRMNRPVKLSERTINMSIGLLAMILDDALRRPDIDLTANAARQEAAGEGAQEDGSRLAGSQTR